jgi:hypothetical protein
LLWWINMLIRLIKFFGGWLKHDMTRRNASIQKWRWREWLSRRSLKIGRTNRELIRVDIALWSFKKNKLNWKVEL